MVSPPRAAKVVAPVNTAFLRNDRLEDPEWLPSSEWTISISFCEFMTFIFCSDSRTVIRGSMSKCLFEIEAVGSPGWIEYGTATPMDFCGRWLFSE